MGTPAALDRHHKRLKETFGGEQRDDRARGQRGTEEQGIHGRIIRRNAAGVNASEG